MIHHRCLDAIVPGKGTKNYPIIEVATPNDKNIANKVIENIANDLTIPMTKLFGMQELNINIDTIGDWYTSILNVLKLCVYHNNIQSLGTAHF